MVTAAKFAEQAASPIYDGVPYSVLDCQAFVEKVLGDCGCVKSNGARYNWTGSNKMWRVALNWKGTIEQAITQFGVIPPGAWLFTVKNDGGEKDRGYNDKEGNASHVGIYLGNNRYRHSTTGGVQYGTMPDKRWTHVGLCKYLDYNTNNGEIPENAVIDLVINKLEECITMLKG